MPSRARLLAFRNHTGGMSHSASIRVLRAKLLGCRVYCISAWVVKLAGTLQSNLRIMPEEVDTIEVDNLEVAQFIYLLLNNPEQCRARPSPKLLEWDF